MRSYLLGLGAFGQPRITLLLALRLLSGLTKSIGLLLLVPLLVIVGASDGAPSPVAERISDVMGVLDIPFTLGWTLVVYVALVSMRSLLGYAQTLSAARLRLEFVDHLRLRLFHAVARAT